MQQTVAYGMPLTATIEGWDGKDVGHLRNLFVFLNQLGHFIEFRPIEIFAPLRVDGGFRSVGQVGDIAVEFSREIFGSLKLHTVFQSLIKGEAVPQIQNRALIRRALHGLEFVGLVALFFDLLQEGRELGENEIFYLAVFPTEQTKNFIVLDEEDRILICHRRVEKNVGQPLDGSQRVTVLESEFLLAVNDEKRIAPDRVERFYATADKHRDFPKLRQIDVVFCRFRWR